SAPEPTRTAATSDDPNKTSAGGQKNPPLTSSEPAVPDSVTITDNTLAKAKRRKKPISVAATPSIGNYQLPSFDFLQPTDQTIKPTETREELMANARLMQNTLAQFDIEVSL